MKKTKAKPAAKAEGVTMLRVSTGLRDELKIAAAVRKVKLHQYVEEVLRSAAHREMAK